MLIDWFTVGAQVVNFLVLVWLLKRFLYHPILRAIDAREQQIAAQLADAQAKQTAAQQERDDLQARSTAFDEQRSALLNQAENQAKAKREQLLDAARQEVDGLRLRQQDELRTDRASLVKEIARLTQDEVFAITRRTLRDLAGASLEDRMSEIFTRRLRNLDDKAKAALAAALQTASEPALLRSTFELTAEPRAEIQKALDETFSAAVQIRFDTAPETICGIELTANGQRIAWSIEAYLTSLQQHVGALLDAPAVPPVRDTPHNGGGSPQPGPIPAIPAVR